jgi:hypothetical protein
MKPTFIYFILITLTCFVNSCVKSTRTAKEQQGSPSPVAKVVDSTTRSLPLPTCFFVVPEIANNIFAEDEQTVIRKFLQDKNGVFKKNLVDNEFEEGVRDTSYQLKLAGNEYTFLRTQDKDILYSAVILSNAIKLCQNLKVGMSLEQLQVIAKIAASNACQAIRIVDDEETTEVNIYLEKGVVKKITYDLLL